MPTYQNSTATTISYNGETWEPNEAKAVNFFAPIEVGLTQTDENPRVQSPTLVSGYIAFTDENDPPERVDIGDCAAFIGSFVVKAGEIEIRENYDDNPVAIKVTPTNNFRVVAKRTEIEAFHIKPLSEAVMAINISRAGV